MTNPKRRDEGGFDARFAAEESSVRPRGDEDPARTPRPPESLLGETVGQRADRIQKKIELAQRITGRLAAADPLRRTFDCAIYRRDEVLLDAVLRAYAKRR